ncbi:MAG: 50S ribosomal protein L7ae [Ruminiclostridium sp.]|nr:50S ribosomal protein L7ae [Ruminiclostridium sp.]
MKGWKGKWRKSVTDKVYSFMGLAMKAGKLVSGEEGCEKTIRSEKSFLVVVAEDASENTAKKFYSACEYRKVPYIRFGQKAALGKILGKEIRSVIAVTDSGFAQKLSELIVNYQSNKKKHGGGLIE